jgi:hypothetical protein
LEANVRAAASGVNSVKIVFLGDSLSESEKSVCVMAVNSNPQKKKKSISIEALFQE